MGPAAHSSEISTAKSNPQIDSQKVILILGDSLTEGYGVAKEKAFPALLAKKIEKKGFAAKVINAGIGGSTSASAAGRLKWSLRAKPQLMILALGANDGLRGVDLKSTKANLGKAIQLAKAQNVKVVLAGMKLPPNYGKEYAGQYSKMYEELAKEHSVPLIPFLLKGVGGRPDLNLPDGIHPNEKGHEVISQTVFSFVEEML